MATAATANDVVICSSFAAPLTPALATSVRIQLRILPVEPGDNQSVHCTHGIFVQTNVLKLLGTFVHDWVVLSGSKNSQGKFSQRFAQLFLLSDGASKAADSEDAHIGYVHRSFAFNLTRALCLRPNTKLSFIGSVLVRKHVSGTQQNSEADPQRSIITGPSPSHCTEMHIARVYSPHSSANISYAQALNIYFAQPRVLAEGDLFSLLHRTPDVAFDDAESSDDEGLEDLERAQRAVMRGASVPVHFVVTSMTPTNAHKLPQTPTLRTRLANLLLNAPGESSGLPRGYLVTSDVTAITCAEATHSFLPATQGVHGSVVVTEQLRELMGVWEPLLHPRTTALRFTASVLLGGAPGAGKRRLVQDAACMLGLHLLERRLAEVAGPMATGPRVEASAKLQALFRKADHYAPCVLHLRRADILGEVNDDSNGPKGPPPLLAAFKAEMARLQSQRRQRTEQVVLVVVSVTDLAELSPAFRESFTHEITVRPPTAGDRAQLLEHIARPLHVATDVSLSDLSSTLSGRSPSELRAILAAAATERLSHLATTNTPRVANALEKTDFDVAVDAVPTSALQSLADAPKIPNIRWEDVGGLEDAKRDIREMVELPLQQPELFESGKGRSGILFFGPPGTGKTLLAKAVATECSVNFLSVKGPELLNMYVGESERNVRNIFAAAHDARPCVLFFDELDSLCPARGRGNDSGGVMDRVVSQFLTELDGMGGKDDSGPGVFVIGATNRPDLLDSALLRPGRFDKLVYLGVSADTTAQLRILGALTRKFTLAPDVDLKKVVEHCSSGSFTGADFYALSATALLSAVKRKIAGLEESVATGGVSTGRGAQSTGRDERRRLRQLLDSMDDSELAAEVKQQDFMDALLTVTPSVSPSEMASYERLRVKFAGANSNKR